MAQVTLDQGQSFCTICDGHGTLCRRCLQPPDDCECDGHLYAVQDECFWCTGLGIEPDSPTVAYEKR